MSDDFPIQLLDLAGKVSSARRRQWLRVRLRDHEASEVEAALRRAAKTIWDLTEERDAAKRDLVRAHDKNLELNRQHYDLNGIREGLLAVVADVRDAVEQACPDCGRIISREADCCPKCDPARDSE